MCIILKKGLIIQSIMSTNRLFTIISEKQKEKCLHTTITDVSRLWHQRYGHLSYKGLRTLQYKDMVHGLPKFPASTIACVDCLNGKQTRSPIPKQVLWRANQPLELIYSDICGPITPTSNSGKRYFLSFIDDYSRKAWVYLLSEKSEALESFKIFKKMVEAEANLSIKCLRTDRGGEYTSTDFNNFCRESGIRKQITNAYTPQQNGVAERKNRTVMNMVRSMLSAKKIPKCFWPEAINWTFHVLNRSPTLAVKDVTPQEAWSGIKPSVKHFKIRGCLAHAHIPTQKRGKLDNKSSTCIFLGISENTKGYRLFNVETNKVIVSRDVVFEENKQWEWGKDYEGQLNSELEWEEQKTNKRVEEIVQKIGEEKETPESEGEVECEKTQETRDHEDEEHSYQEDAEPPVNQRERGQSSVQGRDRRMPQWMNDYVSGENLSDDEAHMVKDAEAGDPIWFEDAVKEEKWRQAMDSEIESIEKK